MLQQLWSNHITDIFLHNKRFCYRYSKAKVLEWVHNFVNQLFNTTLSLNSHRLFSCHLCLGCTPASKSESFQPAACTIFLSCFTEPPHSKLWTMRQCRLVRGLQTCTTHSGGIIMSHRAWKKRAIADVWIKIKQPINNCVRSDMSPPVTAGCIIISQTTVETEK